MEQLKNHFTLEIAPGCFPLSTDSMCLARFVRLGRNARCLDLGSGCGTLGLLLCAREETVQVLGLELDETAHTAALQNIARNHLEPRMESRNQDLRTFRETGFDIVLSNPPYFSGGPESRSLKDARREDTCTLAQLMETAAKALRFGGDLYLVHRPERLGEILRLGGTQNLEGKRLCLLRHREGGPIALILLQLRKGGKPGLIIEEAALHHPDGTTTEYYREVYGE